MERVDDLQYKGLRIIQDPELPCFTADAVLLANFLRAKPGGRVVDLGSGSGVVSILGQAKTGARFVGVEKQRALCELAARSAAMNAQDIPFFCMDVADAPAALGRGTFSAAVCNPPYFRAGERSPDEARALSRHADALEPFFAAAFQLLNNGGPLFLSYPCALLSPVFSLLSRARLEPKRLRLVAANEQKAPYLALIEARKLGKPGLKMENLMFLNRRT